MFHVTLQTLIVAYLLLLLGGLFGLWFVGEILRRRRSKADRRYQVACQVCRCLYEDRSDEPMPVCPQCGRANERQILQDL